MDTFGALRKRDTVASAVSDDSARSDDPDVVGAHIHTHDCRHNDQHDPKNDHEYDESELELELTSKMRRPVTGVRIHYAKFALKCRSAAATIRIAASDAKRINKRTRMFMGVRVPSIPSYPPKVVCNGVNSREDRGYACHFAVNPNGTFVCRFCYRQHKP